MAGSLQDQLLKAGLANKQQAKKATIEKRKKKKQSPDEVAAEKAKQQADIQAKREQKAAQDRALNEARDAEQAERAIDAQVKQLIEHHQITISDRAETRYQFADGKTIKHIYIDESMFQPLTRAQIRVAKLGDGYALVPAVVAERIEQRRPERIIPLSSDQQVSDEDDPYADYAIPDDLMW